jgi:5'-3' exonuclease
MLRCSDAENAYLKQLIINKNAKILTIQGYPQAVCSALAVLLPPARRAVLRFV